MKKTIISSIIALTSMFSYSAPVAEFRAGQAVVTLHNDSKHCLEDKLYAELQDGDKHFKGCWFGSSRVPRAIEIEWEDGDVGLMPVFAFKPVVAL